MKKCPVKRCQSQIPDRTYVCTYHWRCLPAGMREEWSAAAAGYMRDEVSLGDLEEVRAKVMTELEGQPDFQPVRSMSTVCRKCGAQVVTAVLEHETEAVTYGLPLTEVRAGAKAAAEAAGEALCVVGGRAVPADTMSNQYARFVEHKCQPAGG